MVFKRNTHWHIAENLYVPDMQQVLIMAAPHFNATEPGGVQVQVRDTGHWVEFEGLWLWLGVMKDIERS